MTSSLRRAAKVLARTVRVDFDQPDWQSLLRKDPALWRDARARAAGGPKVLIATSHGGHAASTRIESLLAVALTLRGADVHVLLCDGVLPGCLMCSYARFPDTRTFIEEGPQKRVCWDCFPPGMELYRKLGVTVHRYGALLSPEETGRARALAASTPAAEIPGFRVDGAAVGEHALAGALRYFARGTLGDTPEEEAVLRRYFQAALITRDATHNLFGAHRFESACFNHGIYVPQGIIGEVARQRGVRVVNWNPGYRKKCFIFSHGDTYHHTLMTEPTSTWESVEWTPRLERKTVDYLQSRWQGSRDWIRFLHKDAEEDLGAISAELGIDLSKPTIGMLTNVIWDAQLHYPANAFENMVDWALQTVRYFAGRPELQLVIRVHPAEITGTLPSRQLMADEIRAAFPQLPPNVFLIGPESRISTYAVMEQCNAVIIYGTKTGVELTSSGKPVIVAGEAWIRNKGISLDVTSPAGYVRVLDRLPLAGPMDDASRQRARKYAFHFFFRRMIPLAAVEPAKYLKPYRIAAASLGELLPGCDPGLDVICDGILAGSEFVYRAELDGARPGPGAVEPAVVSSGMYAE